MEPEELETTEETLIEEAEPEEETNQEHTHVEWAGYI
ncbi:hypothetical protein PAECIP111802_02236 [Paenibacillus allorhizosphaerae]|uniref:Uncharacterized protein n=1 Tax=Paenibacillus allorhizosphaerae TaxID=2849866 RepID=A0ABN7TLH9_9BACL|nr:hypothetical protein PAECIP111802_02236 [Paenibacillus allorhizosphaerae]